MATPHPVDTEPSKKRVRAGSYPRRAPDQYACTLLMTARMRQSSRSFASSPVWQSETGELAGGGARAGGLPGEIVQPARAGAAEGVPSEQQDPEHDDERDEPTSAADGDRSPAHPGRPPLAAQILDLRGIEPRALAEAHDGSVLTPRATRLVQASAHGSGRDAVP